MKKQRFVIALLLVMCSFFSFSLSSSADNGDTIVYVTRTGECYHNSGCSYLKSKIEITLSDAVSRGYRPCSRCHPPKLDESNATVIASSSPSRNISSKKAANVGAVYDTKQNNTGHPIVKTAVFCVISAFLGGHFVKQSEAKRQAQEKAKAAVMSVEYYPPANHPPTPQVRFQPAHPATLRKPSSVTVHCPLCGSSMVLRNGRYGRFYGCPNYPRCRGTRSYKQ